MLETHQGSGARPSAVVLLSGGMDSAACAALAARDYNAAALHVSYGQRTEARERIAFTRICERMGIGKRLLLRNEVLGLIGGSALTDPKVDVPQAGSDIGAPVPGNFGPFRHAHFPAAGRGWAASVGAAKVVLRHAPPDSSA